MPAGAESPAGAASAAARAPGAASGPAAAAGWLRRYLSCLRFADILALQGSPLLGAAFAMGEVTVAKAAALAGFAPATCFPVAHPFRLHQLAGNRPHLMGSHKPAGRFRH